MKIVQITDTHLSPSKSHFNRNWAPLAEWIQSVQPDLVIHTGDLSVDGADHAADLTFSMDLMRQLPAPVLVLPGNHDVGHLAGSRQPVDAARLARWNDCVGPDHFAEDHGDWRLIGLDALLFGHGSVEEAAHFEWLAETLASRAGRRIAVFSHKPLFIDRPSEGDTGYWGIDPASRQRLLDLFAGQDVALFASGHIHWSWTGALGDMALVWAPSSAFVVDGLEREMPGERMLGAVVHTLGEKLVSEVVAVPGLTRYAIDDVIHEVYPWAVPKDVPEAVQ